MPTFRIAAARPQTARTDVLAVPVFKGVEPGPGTKEIESALGVSIRDLAEQGPLLGNPYKGELGEVISVPTLGKLAAAQVLFVGLGDRAKADAGVARKAGALCARRVGGATTVATTIPQAFRGRSDATCAAFAEGFLLGSYRYEPYKSEQKGKPNRVREVTLLGTRGWNERAIRSAIERAQILAEATNLARDLVNTPSGDKSPESLAREARRMAKTGLKVTVFDEKQLEAKGFGGILAVGQGSPKPPRLIELRYDPPGAKRRIAFVGKGITFDSGGINLKQGEGMDWMKMDMGGGASVLGAMAAIARLRPKGVSVRGYVATSENMPDGNAIRPGDVIRHYGGKTTEVGNTDAEGRLVMADAIVYARERGADVVLDIATLTGACMVALGNKMFGVIGNDRGEVRKVLDAAGRAGEPAWELPLFEDYREVMRSDISDLRNIANKNVGGGAITAALFLSEFADGKPWVHLDIAGPAKADGDEYERSKGATGVGVRTLVEFALADGK